MYSSRPGRFLNGSAERRTLRRERGADRLCILKILSGFLQHFKKHIVRGKEQVEPTHISQDDARQGSMGHQVLYVLGFGLAGAIVANALVFIYFVWLYASG